MRNHDLDAVKNRPDFSDVPADEQQWFQSQLARRARYESGLRTHHPAIAQATTLVFAAPDDVRRELTRASALGVNVAPVAPAPDLRQRIAAELQRAVNLGAIKVTTAPPIGATSTTTTPPRRQRRPSTLDVADLRRRATYAAFWERP